MADGNVHARARDDQLLSPDFMTRLDRLELLSRKIFVGRMKGERRSKRRGESVEFADYRNYVKGDDLRFLDWNIYGRLERLMLKLFLEEEDLNVSVLFDVSRSIDWGDPHKGLYVKRVAASLAYIGLCNYDRVSLYGYSDALAHEMVGVRGRRLVSRVLDFLQRIEYEGRSHFTVVAKRFALRHRGKGVVVVIGDFLDKGGYADGLRYLIGRDFDLYLIQVLSPDEIDPQLTGDLRLVDVEDEDDAEITISKPLLNKYKSMLTAYCQELKNYCTRRGVTYLFTNTRVPFDTLVLTYLRQRGLVR
jgi:uncharacterized protein (DUF58 family)